MSNVRKINRILISQPAPPANSKHPLMDISEQYKIEIQFRPFIKVERLSVKEFRLQRINILDFTGIVMTSKNAIDHFFSLCEELKITMPETMKYFCTSETVALYLQKYIVYRKRKIFFSPTGKVDGLNVAFAKHSKEKLLFPIPEEHNNDVQSFLSEKELDYTESIMYRTVSNDFEEGEKMDADMLIFFTPMGVQSLLKNFPDFKQNDMAIGCFGTTTAKAIEDAGFRLDCMAPTPEYPSLGAALEAFIKENHKHHS